MHHEVDVKLLAVSDYNIDGWVHVWIVIKSCGSEFYDTFCFMPIILVLESHNLDP